MKKAIYLLLVAALFCPAFLMAQNKENTSSDAKIDSIYNLQKKMYKESKMGPLVNKNYGIEVNPFRFLIMDQATTFSGSFSLFNVNRQAELAFPVYFQAPKHADDLTELTVDCHYRYFLGKYQNGFYLSAFTRFAYLDGTVGNNDIFNENPTPGVHDTKAKLGLGFGLGYRIFSSRGLYWGTSLSFGRYITGGNDHFRGNFLTLDDDEPYILDFEFLKFGWSF